MAAVTEESLDETGNEDLVALHRRVHALALRGGADGAELERVHDLTAAAVEQRGGKHRTPLEPDEIPDWRDDAKARPGLYLQPPHGFLLWRGKKAAVAKSGHFVRQYAGKVAGVPLVVVSGDEAFGLAVLGKPAEMTVEEFDRAEWFDRHRVKPEERKQWWPDAETLFVYDVKNWEPYGEPRPVELERGVQNYIRDVEFKAYEPPTDRERDVLEKSKRLPKSIVLVERAVNLTGSLLYGKHMPRDADFVMVGAEWRPEEDRFVVPLTPSFKEKLERALAAVYDIQRGNIEYITEGRGASFDHLPVYSLALVRPPRLEVVHVSEGEPDFAALCYDKPEAEKAKLSASALERKLRGASAEIRRQAKQTHDEDEVKPGRMVLSLKPLRPAPQGERQVVSHFYKYIEENLEFPLYCSPKRDGATHYVHGDGKGRVWFFSDDGEDNTERLPNLAEAFRKKYEGKSFVLGVEVEKWVGGEHYPREAAIGDVKKSEDGDLAANVFRAVYWDGRDLHAKPFSEVWDIMRKIPADSRSDGKLWPRRDGPVNVVPHYEVKSMADLRKRLAMVAYKPGVEGVVVKRADGAFPLDGEPGKPPTAVKWHKSLDAKVRITGRTETKTAGVYTYSFAVGDMEIGKTFGSKTKLNVGDAASVEAEQINVERDEGGEIIRVSFWAPELMGAAEGEPESLETVIKRARRHGVLREKVRGKGGEVEYLPNEPGEPATADKGIYLSSKEAAELAGWETLSDEALSATEPPAWAGPDATLAGAKAGKPEDYPDESKKLRYVVQIHFRGRSAHADPRFEFERGDDEHLRGWTVACQQPGAIKEPVTTMEQAEAAVRDARNWKMDLKTGEVKKRRIRGGAVRRGDLRAFPKATEIPGDWLGVEGVTDKPDPGEPVPVGATREYPGVFVIVARGEVEWGARKPYFEEYFLSGDWEGRWTFRMIGREEKGTGEGGEAPHEWTDLETGLEVAPGSLDGAFSCGAQCTWADWEKAEVLPPGVEEERPRTRTYWVLLQADPEPYVLSKSAVDKGWLPPKGVSCLPRSVRKKVPARLRYWETSGGEALERRAELAEMDIRELGGTETKKKQAGQWRPYVLQRHWYKGQVVIRWGASHEHHDLRVKLDGKHWHLVLDGDPLRKDEVAAYEETKESGDVRTVEGDKIKIFDIGGKIELEPGQPANPTKDTPAYIETVDRGQARIIGDKPEFRKVEFKGGKLRGAWFFRREEPDGDMGVFGRSAGPQTKESGVTYIYTCSECEKDFESEDVLDEAVCGGCKAEPAAEGRKVGKRLRADKVDVLREIKDSFEAILDKLKELLGFAEYADKEPPTMADFFKGDSGFSIKKVKGATWFVAWTTNAFQDRQREIFSTEGLEKYVLESEKREDRGTFNFWHINEGAGTDFARKEWQGVAGRFLVEAGPFLDDHQGRSVEAFLRKHPDGHPDFAPEGWGCSPEYRYLPEERKAGIYEWVWITRTSVLPRAAAANMQTRAMEVETMALTDQQRKAADEIFGEEWVEKNLVEESERRTKELEEAGVAYKEAEPEEAAPEPGAEEGEKQAGKFAAALKDIAGQVEDEPTKKAILDAASGLNKGNMEERGKTLRMLSGKLKGDLKARLKKIADAMVAGEAYPAARPGRGGEEEEEEEYPYPKKKKDFDELAAEVTKHFAADLGPLAEAITKVFVEVKAVGERVGKLEKAEALKAETELPRYVLNLTEAGQRASQAAETEVKEGDPLADMKPEETPPSKVATHAGRFFGH